MLTVHAGTAKQGVCKQISGSWAFWNSKTFVEAQAPTRPNKSSASDIRMYSCTTGIKYKILAKISKSPSCLMTAP